MRSWSADVLVVEDDPDLNQLVGAYIELAGLGYRPAHTGGDGLAEARRQPPAAIILDLMLPDMSGFDVCQEVKHEEPDIPVIMLTALADEASRRRGADCGADEYLTKPFDPDDLIRVVTHHTGRNGRVAGGQ
jgi:DNA-binding response OmpR family regulator